jgi:hypothetical protein
LQTSRRAKVKLIGLLALAAVGLGTAASAEPSDKRRGKPVRVTEECTRDRCAVYVNGRRWGSHESDDTGRVVVRDRRGRVVVKIDRDD